MTTMNMTRREAHRAEIERDHRLVSLGFLQALERLLDDELARLMVEQNGAAPFLLLERVEAVVTDTHVDLRCLDKLRTDLRAARGVNYADRRPLPEALAMYRHRGNYHGAFATMADLGGALGLGLGLPDAWMTPLVAAALAEGLHRRGEVWTFERSSIIHVFCKPQSTAERVLATRAGRWIDCHDAAKALTVRRSILRIIP